LNKRIRIMEYETGRRDEKMIEEGTGIWILITLKEYLTNYF